MTGDDEAAALWAVGALNAREHDATGEQLRHDPALVRLAGEWETDLAALATLLRPEAPSDRVLGAIEARLDQQAPPANRTLRAADGEWLEFGPGIRVKILHRDLVAQRQTILLEADPGAVHPAHEHEFDEEIYIVSGDLVIEGQELRAGDFHFSPKGSQHPAETTRDGCLCVITTGFH